MITVEVIAMQKNSTISLRVDSNLKNDVESILNTLGIASLFRTNSFDYSFFF
jgi:hypothetical protein